MNLFLLENNSLIISDASGANFDLKSSLKRLRKGYNLIEFDYVSAKTQIVKFKSDKFGFSVKDSRGHKKKISYDKLQGIFLGSSGSTFEKFKSKGGNLKIFDLED